MPASPRQQTRTITVEELTCAYLNSLASFSQQGAVIEYFFVWMFTGKVKQCCLAREWRTYVPTNTMIAAHGDREMNRGKSVD